MQQTLLTAANNYEQLEHCLTEKGIRHLFLVCDRAFPFLRINGWFGGLTERTGIAVTVFSAFTPNPKYEEVREAVLAFRAAGCDAVMAVGGGSAMDVAKCVKLFAQMNPEMHFLKQFILENNIPLLAMPTTAGSGSEATRFAVIYDEGVKQSVAHESCIPDTVLLDASALQTVPPYQRSSTMMDALCHAMESFWSVNSTAESKQYATAAIRLILNNMEGCLANTDAGNAGMLQAAHTAGKAINITQTTAGHAMCYKLTSLYGLAHGHAAAMCVRVLFPWMLTHTDRCVDPRGEAYLTDTFAVLARAMGCESAGQAAERFAALTDRLELGFPVIPEEDLDQLTAGVNPERLKNNPVALTDDDIRALYAAMRTGAEA